MTALIYPPAEAAPTGATNMPVNIEHVHSMRKLTLIGPNLPGIQFFMGGPGTNVEWAFVTAEDRDTTWSHIMTDWGVQVG